MQKKLGITTVILTLLSLVFVTISFADVPPPPVNQKIGIPDSIFNNLDEAGCRLCHDDPNIVPGPPGAPGSGNVNRHHLRYGTPQQTGFCSRDVSIECLGDEQCPSDGLCSVSQTVCTDDSQCPEGQICGQLCVGDSIAPFPPAADGTYECTTCHPIETNGSIVITAVRNCTEGGVGFTCHQQIVGEASVHHLTARAQDQDCVFCHGDVVDNRGDGHIIPTYEPSLVTPAPSGGNGLPLNSRGNGAGACNYCHDSGMVNDVAFLDSFPGPIEVFENQNTHHNTGLGLFDNNQCIWCHQILEPLPDIFNIRVCEGCHGFDSLHNIAVDSDDPDTVFTPAGENPGWSHVGNNDDCWGCHGFATVATSDPVTGPVIPYIGTTDTNDVLTGTAATVTLTGSAFVNTVDSTMYSSTVVMTDADGMETELIPDSITESSLTFTVPATVPSGNYHVRAAKEDVRSNPVPIAVVPDVTIDSMICSGKRTLTITGSDFGDRDLGSEDYLYVEAGGVTARVTYWSDSQIVARVPNCMGTFTAVVNALFGAESKVCDKRCTRKRIRR